jgi:FdhD protein
MTDRVTIAPITRVERGRARTDQDLVAIEAPLAIHLTQPSHGRDRTLGLVMRTPGDDRDLVLGLLHAEGVIRSADQVAAIEIAGEAAHVTLAAGATPDAAGGRALEATTACGLCGRLELQTIERRRGPEVSHPLAPAVVAEIPAALRARQSVFAETGGLHAAALVDRDGRPSIVREDVGRHNAVDKVVGAALAAGRIPASDAILAVSGRVAFEIVQKAALAGFGIIVAVGAPSSLAVEAARAADLTLIGFTRDGRFNVYTGVRRVAPADSEYTA